MPSTSEPSTAGPATTAPSTTGPSTTGPPTPVPSTGPSAAGPLCPRLARALEGVELRADARTAYVGGRAVEAKGPRHLLILLKAALYEHLHAGCPADAYLEPVRDLALERELAAAMPHRNTVATARLHDRRDGELLVDTDGVLVRVPEDRLLPDGPESPDLPDGPDGPDLPNGPGLPNDPDRPDGPDIPNLRNDPNGPVLPDGPEGPNFPDGPESSGGPESHDGPEQVRLAMPAARPALSPGFFLADGSRGGSRKRPMLRVYVNLQDRESVVPAWAAVLRCLEDRGVAYRAKVGSSPAGLSRRDALVVYLGSDGLDAVVPVAEAVAGIPGRGEEVSVFAERVAAGVGVGWQPAGGKAAPGMSFGQHRAAAVAEGLAGHALGTRGGPPAEAVAEALREAGIDPAAPYRNLDSPPDRFHTPGGSA